MVSPSPKQRKTRRKIGCEWNVCEKFMHRNRGILPHGTCARNQMKIELLLLCFAVYRLELLFAPCALDPVDL